MINTRKESEEMQWTEKREACQRIVREIYDIVKHYAVYSPSNSYRYQITHLDYLTDENFAENIVEGLQKVFPDFLVQHETKINLSNKVVMLTILVEWF